MMDAGSAIFDNGIEARDVGVSNLTAGGAALAAGIARRYRGQRALCALAAGGGPAGAALRSVLGNEPGRLPAPVPCLQPVPSASSPTSYWRSARFLVALELARRGRALAAAGWLAILLSVVVFTFVDAIVGYVLGPVAATAGGAGAFAGFKLLFDALFLLGTTAFGAGAMVVSTDELRSPRPIASKPVAIAAALTGLAGVLAAAACFSGFPLQQGVGISIGLGSAVFARDWHADHDEAAIGAVAPAETSALRKIKRP